MQSLKSRRLSNSGIAVISLLLSSTFTCPRVNPFSAAQALTIYVIGVSVLPARRNAFPSIAIISLLICERSVSVQEIKHLINDLGSAALNTRLNVS